MAIDIKGALGNPLATGIGGFVIGASLAGASVAAINSRKKSRRKSASKRSRKSRRAPRAHPKKRSPRYARTAGKGRDRSTRRIRMTKNGQPYIILKSGKARFIKKGSARASRRRKGGRY